MYVSKHNIHVDIVILSSISPAEQTIPATLLAMQAYIVRVSFLLIVGLTADNQRRLVMLLSYYRTHIPDDVSTYSFART